MEMRTVEINADNLRALNCDVRAVRSIVARWGKVADKEDLLSKYHQMGLHIVGDSRPNSFD